MSVSPLAYPNYTKFSMHLTYEWDSVADWWHYNMLCTSGFVDDVIFADNDQE